MSYDKGHTFAETYIGSKFYINNKGVLTLVRILSFPEIPFESILNEVVLSFHNFDLARCDERTFYISISIASKQQKVIGDLIFLTDKQDLYGAISLNEKYDEVRAFFKKLFDYDLLYSDELAIAHAVRKFPQFKKSLQQYAVQYPKNVQSKFFH